MEETIAKNIYEWMKKAQSSNDPYDINQAIKAASAVKGKDNKIILSILDILVSKYNITIATRKTNIGSAVVIENGLKYKNLVVQI